MTPEFEVKSCLCNGYHQNQALVGIGENVKNWNPHILLVRMLHGTVTVAKSFAVSQKVKHS